MNLFKIKYLVISLFVTCVNWSIINFVIVEIPFNQYIFVELIWIVSYKLLEIERKRLKMESDKM
jgi:hypothetical protein